MNDTFEGRFSAIDTLQNRGVNLSRNMFLDTSPMIATLACLKNKNENCFGI